MEPGTKHIKKDRTPYLHLFPKAEEKTYVLKKSGAKLSDTIELITHVLPLVAYQTERLSKLLVGKTPYESCKKIFDWIYNHIEYRRDERNKEQIKSPQRTAFDGFGDCDDMQLLACSLMYNLGIPFKMRTTVYDEAVGVQHIYPYALINQRPVYMDCVAQKFDYQVPYLRKIDYELPFINYSKKMELQFLNGVPEARPSANLKSIDAEDLLDGFDEEEIGQLGKGKLKEKIQNTVKKVQNSNAVKKVQNTAQKVKNSKVVQAVKKGVHTVNRVNPATVLLRTGILIGLKTNLFKVSENLRFTYLSPSQVQAKGLDENKIKRLTEIRQKLEKIFFGAGGLVGNFKNAILTGKGNQDKQVPLSGFSVLDYTSDVNGKTPSQILGIDTYNSEIGSVEGLGELGVATEAALASATGVFTAIAALIKSIGSLRKDKTAQTNTTSNNQNQTTDDNSNPGSSEDNTSPAQSEEPGSSNQDTSNYKDDPISNGGGVANESTSTENAATTSKAEGSQTNSNESADSSGEEATNPGEENPSNANARSSANKPATGTEVSNKTTQVSTMTKVWSWVKENPLPATGIGIVVVGGITWGLVSLLSGGKKESKSNFQGLPKKKKKKFHSSKIKFQKLR